MEKDNEYEKIIIILNKRGFNTNNIDDLKLFLKNAPIKILQTQTYDYWIDAFLFHQYLKLPEFLPRKKILKKLSVSKEKIDEISRYEFFFKHSVLYWLGCKYNIPLQCSKKVLATLKMVENLNTVDMIAHLKKEFSKDFLWYTRDFSLTDQRRQFYHVTSLENAINILHDKINLYQGSIKQDFSHGNGFYLDHSFQNSLSFAHNPKFQNSSSGLIAILVFNIMDFEYEEMKKSALMFENETEAWKKCVLTHRTGQSEVKDYSQYSFIFGPQCSNLNEFINKEQSTTNSHPIFQWCLKSEKCASIFDQSISKIIILHKSSFISIANWMNEKEINLVELCQTIGLDYHPHFWYVISHEKNWMEITHFSLGKIFIARVRDYVQKAESLTNFFSQRESYQFTENSTVFKWLDDQRDLFMENSIAFDFFNCDKMITLRYDEDNYDDYSIILSLFQILNFRAKRDKISIELRIHSLNSNHENITNNNQYYKLTEKETIFEEQNPFLFFVRTNRIDKGTYGRVYCGNVYFKDSDKKHSLFTIKELKKNSQDFDKKTKKTEFMKEWKILQKLKGCKNISQIVAAGENQNYFFLIYDWIKGQNLLQFSIKMNSFLPEIKIKFIFEQMINVLQTLKKFKIAHHDIKLENFIINDDFEIHLIDFGFSEHVSNTNLSEINAGSFEYLAPEKYFGPNFIPYDPYISDLWSTSICLYALVFRKFPNSKIEIRKSFLENDEYPKININPSMISLKLSSFFIELFRVNPQNRILLENIKNSPWMKDNE